MSKSLSRNLIALATLVGATATAAADDTAKAGSEFGYFVGTWKCTEKWSKSDFGPAYESTSTLVASSNTDGVWIAWSYVQDASAKNQHPPKGNDLWGYDPEQKTFIREKFDNYAPGAITHLTSKGFIGDTITWDGDVHTPKGAVPFKHSFKKLDDKTIEGHLSLGGKEFYQGKCKKS
jgi:hypothetical protein